MLAIIGGTGLYNLEGAAVVREHPIETPFGKPSAAVTEIELGGARVLFLPRHGVGHALLPSEVNYRANIYALKALGASHVLGVSAVGSLAEEIRPGDFALPSQYLDLTKGIRRSTFFGDGILAHVSTADPVCHQLASIIANAARAGSIDRTVHTECTYACVEGPRLGTQAESKFLRLAGCHLVGMTNVPEAFLAREAQLCYASLCVATDYDCWRNDPSEHVTLDELLKRYAESLEFVKATIARCAAISLHEGCTQCRTLTTALLSKPENLRGERREVLHTLLR